MNNIVNSFNEWDPLEEVIVGSIKGAAKMGYEPSVSGYYYNQSEKNFKGKEFLEKEIEEAEKQLDDLAALLEKEGVIVKRPDYNNFCQQITTPDFNLDYQNCSACPRDVLLVIGDEIIEAPMAQRARFFEYRVYRSLIKEYFKLGAKWTTAPKPTMSDKLYIKDFSVKEVAFDADTHPALTDYEPCFDAASFVRFGKDIFYQPDLVTNDFGAQWLKSHLGEKYRIHRIKFADKHPPQHIDTTLVPIREGIVLINPERPCINNGLQIFKDNNWELIKAPPSIQSVEFHSPEVSNWISMNILCINDKKIIVEEKEEAMIKLLESLDFEVLTCPFDKVYKFGGGFHCCTTDIRRSGNLKSYFPSLD
eukprot:GHVR01059071.1.p3 GENE.GHVR01059071.1~~GHVR01059071.1.p3  ORF type:complete len:363 (-),score=63.08 GHVR01059071.1:6246-7334(-)